MGGKFTWGSVIGTLLLGVSPIVSSIGNPEINIVEGVQLGLPYFLAALGAFGLGRKIEKNTSK